MAKQQPKVLVEVKGRFQRMNEVARKIALRHFQAKLPRTIETPIELQKLPPKIEIKPPVAKKVEIVKPVPAPNVVIVEEAKPEPTVKKKTTRKKTTK